MNLFTPALIFPNFIVIVIRDGAKQKFKKIPLFIFKNSMSFLFFKCNRAFYPKSILTPKEGFKNVDIRLHRPIYILYKKKLFKNFALFTKYKNIRIIYYKFIISFFKEF